MQACRRAARAVFLGERALGGRAEGPRRRHRARAARLRPAPGQFGLGKYDDALRRLADRLHYLYSGNDRFWFDLRPNLRREMEDRLHRFDNHELHLLPGDSRRRLQKVVKTAMCTVVHVFTEAKDVPDNTDLRLVVPRPRPRAQAQGHRSSQRGCEGRGGDPSTHHGDKPREYQNRLLFLAPDASAAATMRDHVRRYLAWHSIVKDTNELNLDKHHEAEANKNLGDANAIASTRASRRRTASCSCPCRTRTPRVASRKVASGRDEALTLRGSHLRQGASRPRRATGSG